ncbi:hypothetical protein SAMN05192534_101570 [Alteribacillus persepolensis]|uniref:Uncharacterized protein n=1 Tax=Alteribacillus persepolensis TaxID=568899 RepID=A0A1G7ZJR3_9BACI|nr:hypothetical protein [Alteribacillus persepolensis]SDH08796.1 hypothetical protein SAMN05192534_101570 [Alteribacillus persepolensis]
MAGASRQREQAETLRYQTEQKTKKRNDDDTVDVLSLPPRKKVHRKKKRIKSVTLVRVLLVVFLLIVTGVTVLAWMTLYHS